MEIKDKIIEIIKQNNVCLFMKGTPESPQCGFSMTVSNILKYLKVNFKGINILEDENLRQGIKDFSDWPTIPQLYINEEFIGGCDIVKELFENGELKKILEEKKNNINYFSIKHISESFKFPLYILIFFIVFIKFVCSSFVKKADLKCLLFIREFKSSSNKISSTSLLYL